MPLIDLGTIRLPRLIGHSRAADLIITGRSVSGEEAYSMGLVNRLSEPGSALTAAVDLAEAIARFPQTALRNDLASLRGQWGLDESAAARLEFGLGMETIASRETEDGARRFADGAGRHGSTAGDTEAG